MFYIAAIVFFAVYAIVSFRPFRYSNVVLGISAAIIALGLLLDGANDGYNLI